MRVLVSEAGPRDGLQSIKRAIPAAVKHRWIRALAEAGLAKNFRRAAAGVPS